MNGDNDNNESAWLTRWEQECADDIEGQPDYEQSLNAESDISQRKIWAVFQDSATSIAQFYRDRFTNDPTSLWISFQTAAGTVTSLYKESCDGIKRASEMAKQCGYQKRNRELLNWAKRKRALIRREDLLAYLSGKPPPPRTNHHHHHHHHHSYNHHRLSPRPTSSLGIQSASQNSSGMDAMDTFREALVRTPISRRPLESDLLQFITGEIQRNTKRSASPTDVTMGSPTHNKKARYM